MNLFNSALLNRPHGQTLSSVSREDTVCCDEIFICSAGILVTVTVAELVTLNLGKLRQSVTDSNLFIMQFL